ncbi:hypothetical protein B1813_18990 [Saccharomonospora piscinae]|uniref:HK97 gp10 family phage protein n=1 Tax=Saccharomonospora piscinae TaxID=687388 RepID=A0A1V8ZYA6_SACPI|nr:hypothetical protein [Saccharomonospora piscinae]OQO89927.1 hypothetical protein B1813_18990 [Saccharomonospora piscinae]
MRLDIDGARELADDLDDVPKELRDKVRQVVSKGALNIKNDMQREAQSAGDTRHFARAHGYDMLSDTEAEIGPELGRVQGPLGLLYTGTSRHGPVLSVNGPADREEPRFELALIRVVEDTL